MEARLDVQLENSASLAEASTAALKAGLQVSIRECDGGHLTVETTDGLPLGSVPDGQAAKLREGQYNGHIRTIKRNSGTSIVEYILIRFVLHDNSLRPAGEQINFNGVVMLYRSTAHKYLLILRNDASTVHLQRLFCLRYFFICSEYTSCRAR